MSLQDDTDERVELLFNVRLTKAEAAELDRMREEGGYTSRNALVRSLLVAIIEDEMMVRVVEGLG